MSFYERGRHEKVLGDLSATEEMLNEEGLSAEEQEYLKEEKTRLMKEHTWLLNRAWSEALKENERIDAVDAHVEQQVRAEDSYLEARNRFVNFMGRTVDEPETYLEAKKIFPSEIDGMAEMGVSSSVAEDGSTQFSLTFAYPFRTSEFSSADGEYEEREAQISVGKDGSIGGWEKMPVTLQADVEGKAKILNELMRCLAELGIQDVRHFEVDVALVQGSGGEGEKRNTTPEMGKGEQERIAFSATERFRILKEHGFLFVCSEVGAKNKEDAYSAFVYPDVIVFDSLNYRNGLYFLKLETPIDVEAFEQIDSLPEEDQKELMNTLLTQAGFYEEIAKSKQERRSQGHRYPSYHPRRPADPEDERYRAHLERYYRGFFEYIRKPDDAVGARENAEQVPGVGRVDQ